MEYRSELSSTTDPRACSGNREHGVGVIDVSSDHDASGRCKGPSSADRYGVGCGRIAADIEGCYRLVIVGEIQRGNAQGAAEYEWAVGQRIGCSDGYRTLLDSGRAGVSSGGSECHRSGTGFGQACSSSNRAGDGQCVGCVQVGDGAGSERQLLCARKGEGVGGTIQRH